MLDFAKSAAEDGKHFFYLRIPEDIGPLERGDRYEDPLQDALTAANLGEITGGGSQLGEGNSVEYCGIDIVVTDRERGLALIRETMQSLGALLPPQLLRSIFRFTESMNSITATPDKTLRIRLRSSSLPRQAMQF